MTLRNVDTLQASQAKIEATTKSLDSVSQSTDLCSLMSYQEIDRNGILQALQNAYSVPPMSFGLANVGAAATAYGAASGTLGDAASAVGRAKGQTLPGVWQGPAWESASTVFSAVGNELAEFSTNLGSVSGALNAYTNTVSSLPTSDSSARATLYTEWNKAISYFETAGNQVPAPAPYNEGYVTVGQLNLHLKSAATAVQERLSAWQTFDAAAESLIGVLTQVDSELRAGAVAPGSVDAVEAVVLAQSADQDGSGNSLASTDIDGGIIDTNSLMIGSQRLEDMSAADQATFNSLIHSCGSAQEAAYLFKAMAAGEPLDTVEQFHNTIKTHGGDPDWLAQHLNISLSADPGFAFTDVEYGDSSQRPFSQGGNDDCVAASTFMAALQNDPVLALYATAGFTGGPNSPLVQRLNGLGIDTSSGPQAGDDSLSAVQSRIQALFTGSWSWGRHNDGMDSPVTALDPSSGVGPSGEQNLANQWLGPANGVGYHYTSLSGASDREAALDQIQSSLADGTPVTFVADDPTASGIVSSLKNSHQMVIIGQSATDLEIYNPWGYTVWIPKQSFIDGDISAVTSPGGKGNISMPYAIEIPKPTS